jgi:hypothetical protein
MKFVRVLVQSYWIPGFLPESGRNRWRSVKSSVGGPSSFVGEALSSALGLCLADGGVVIIHGRSLSLVDGRGRGWSWWW